MRQDAVTHNKETIQRRQWIVMETHSRHLIHPSVVIHPLTRISCNFVVLKVLNLFTASLIVVVLQIKLPNVCVALYCDLVMKKKN